MEISTGFALLNIYLYVNIYLHWYYYHSRWKCTFFSVKVVVYGEWVHLKNVMHYQ